MIAQTNQTNQTNQKDKPPERLALGAILSLTESTAKLFGRSIFQLNALRLIEGTTLVVTAVEYGMGALVLLLVAYSPYLLRVRRHREVLLLVAYSPNLLRVMRYRNEGQPARLFFSKQVVFLMVVIGALNIMGRGFSAFSLDSPGMTVALFNAIGFSMPVLLFSIEGWKGHKAAALIVPVLTFAGLAIAAKVWESDASTGGVLWALAGGLCSLVYLPLSRYVLDMGKAPADQFQALNTFIGAVGLVVWALLAGESLTKGWSWRLVIILMITSMLSVVIPRYLHVIVRQTVGDGFYAILSMLSLLLALGVDYVMEHRTPTIWQVAGLSLIGLVALAVAHLKSRDQKQPIPPPQESPLPPQESPLPPAEARRGPHHQEHRWSVTPKLPWALTGVVVGVVLALAYQRSTRKISNRTG